MLRLVLFSGLVILLLVTSLSFLSRLADSRNNEGFKDDSSYEDVSFIWYVPDTNLISNDANGNLVRYGRELVVNTSFFLGPEGILKPVANGLNCQSCHLDAGTKLWGNNFGAVASLYPKYRPRSGIEESIEKKINDCFERSMNGRPLDSAGREMRAMIAYMKWLGSSVRKGVRPYGSGLKKLPFLSRAADTVKGKEVFQSVCAVCHGSNGQGQLNAGGKTFQYPPLWGNQSYNTGAGIYRLSKFAAFVKHNMPFGVQHDKPVLTDEEAWDVAAYVNSQPRPAREFNFDWPDLTKKPVDHPFGPYADSFSEYRHKYGPFDKIKNAME